MDMPRLLVQVRDALRLRHYSLRTEEAYLQWIRCFISFHEKRHPNQLGEADIERFLSNLAVTHKVAAATQNQTLSAILFLYQKVLGRDPEWMESVTCAKRPVRIPVVLTREETQRTPQQLEGTRALVLKLMYGTGMRLMEALRLRTKNIDFGYRQITVREGKGFKDRVVPLPQAMVAPLSTQREKVRAQHLADLDAGFGSVARTEYPTRIARGGAPRWRCKANHHPCPPP
jgi:site-specific recombinase XerD